MENYNITEQKELINIAFWGGFITACTICLIVLLAFKDRPTAMDYHQGKVAIKRIYVDGECVDSVAVYKRNKE